MVERANTWINHCRRLDRHYEITLDAHEGFLVLSQIAVLLRRLDRSQLIVRHPLGAVSTADDEVLDFGELLVD